MKTVRTRVKSAFKRNSKFTIPPSESVPLNIPAASTSAPSILLPGNTKDSTTPLPSPVTARDKDQNYLGFRLESEPAALPTNDNYEKHEGLDLSDFTFTGEEPERVYVPPQPIIITDDSRRSTPKKRVKLQTTLPPSNHSADDRDVEVVSPIDSNYLIDDIGDSGPSLLEQPAPTDRSFVELTPSQEPSPLPPLHEVLAQQAQLKHLESSLAMTRAASNPDHEEDKPLLESSLSTAEVDDILDSVWPLPPQNFASLGWTEHVLPSSSYYYSHAETHTVTDIDLRDEKKLTAVKSYIKNKLVSTPDTEKATPSGSGYGNDDNTIRNIWVDPTSQVEEGVDVWLRDANPGLAMKSGSDWEFMPMRNWVIHAIRAVTFESPSEYHGGDDLSDEDRLDLENRYWQYMSMHPAHASLPQSAYDEAFEVLTWCHTDRVLRVPQPFSVPQPFTTKECADLLELLRSVSTPFTSHSTQVARTRLIAQILLRYTEWRQKYVTKSSHEKFPNTLSGRPIVEHAIPFRRTLLGIFKGVLCLGIPYLYEESHSHEGPNPNFNVDEEQAMMRPSRSGDVLLGSTQPLVAALLLSASATLLSLPELGKTSRVTALISALFAAASLVSSVIALHARHRQRRVQGSSTASSRRSILSSLPLVMLAYSLCAFVVSVIAYSITGSLGTTRGNGFGRFTGLATIVVWIVLVIVLAASATITKKEL